MSRYYSVFRVRDQEDGHTCPEFIGMFTVKGIENIITNLPEEYHAFNIYPVTVDSGVTNCTFIHITKDKIIEDWNDGKEYTLSQFILKLRNIEDTKLQ